jgi:hypothetical protein
MIGYTIRRVGTVTESKTYQHLLTMYTDDPIIVRQVQVSVVTHLTQTVTVYFT